MKNKTFHWCVATALLAGVGLGVGSAVAQRGEGEPAKAKKGAWLPPEEDRSAYRDIVDFNIFSADRRRIAERVDRNRNPPPDEPDRPPVDTTVDKPPPNPDASWRLAGISHDESGAVAYIEHTDSGEVSRIKGPSEFSQGQITAIGYDTIMYVVKSEQRVIRIGESLVGERVVLEDAKATSSGSSKSGSSKSGSSGASLQDRLKALRERRAREQGTAPPPKPDTPDEPAGGRDGTEQRDDSDRRPSTTTTRTLEFNRPTDAQ